MNDLSEAFEEVIQETTASASERAELRKLAMDEVGNLRPSQKKLVDHHGWTWPRFDAFLQECEWAENTRLEMASMLLHRVMKIANAKRDEAARKRHADTHPYWYLSPIDDGLSPARCVDLKGRIKRWDDPLWKSVHIPCERLYCRCSIVPLTVRQAERRMDRSV